MRNKTIVISIVIGCFWLSGTCLAARPDGNATPISIPKAKKADTAASPTKQGTGETAAPTADHADFLKGYAAFQKNDYNQASLSLYKFMAAGSPDDVDYEWAEFFLGLSLDKLGYTHGAVDLLSDLVARKPNPKIVSYCLEFLEATTRGRAFDRKLVMDHVLSDQSYGFIEADIADFVNYYQGEYDWRNGFDLWGDEHFNQIRSGTLYHYKYLFKKALYEIAKDRIDDAIGLLAEIIDSPVDDMTLKDDARKTLARLYYERGQFSEADWLYTEIEMNILAQAQNLVERAWVHYRQGHAERAMGLLYSFEAPSYRDAFTPEFFILKAFIYKDVCHYRKALAIVTEFNQMYGDSLKEIENRSDHLDNADLMSVILHKKHIRRTYDFLVLLERERANIPNFTDPGLVAFLDEMYSLKQDQYTALLRKQTTEAYQQMANQLLAFQEEAHLMEYEIGLDMFQRVYQYHYIQEDGADGKEAKSVAVYPFQGEFWNDELANYSVNLPSKCGNLEEWDIFFK